MAASTLPLDLDLVGAQYCVAESCLASQKGALSDLGERRYSAVLHDLNKFQKVRCLISKQQYWHQRAATSTLEPIHQQGTLLQLPFSLALHTVVLPAALWLHHIARSDPAPFVSC